MFSMDTFVKSFQPELWDSWKKGLDIKPHPEDPPDKIAEFQLRIDNPQEYVRMKQDQFERKNAKHTKSIKAPVTSSTLKQEQEEKSSDATSHETKIYHVYQHHELSNVKITVDPETMEFLGSGQELLQKFLDTDDVNVKELIENCLLIKIGEKEDSSEFIMQPVHVYRHTDMQLEAKVDSKSFELVGDQMAALTEFLGKDKDIKQLITLGTFTFCYEGQSKVKNPKYNSCLLYTSDAADE